MSAFLILENISKYYTSGQSVVMGLQGVSLEFALGEFVAITGESGSGKSTLAKVIAGILPYESGEMSINGKPTSHYGLPDWEQYRIDRISFISQNYDILPGCTVIENVVSALILTGMDKTRAKGRAEEILTEVELLDKKKRRAAKLSSGQKQRLSIARALAKPASILIADEPTGNLDEENTLNICTLLRQISKTSLVVMVTHEEQIARFFADRIITLSDGRVAADETEWKREKLIASGGNTLYAGDYESSHISKDSIAIRILTKKGTAPADLTIAVLNDKIIIKTDDARTISCSKNGELPVIKEGNSPVLTLSEMDDTLTPKKTDAPAKAGFGFSFRKVVEEARRMKHGEGIRHKGIWFFLAAITVLTVWIVGDYLTLSTIDPKEFIVSDSHILEMTIERGSDLDPLDPDAARGVISLMPKLIATMKAEGADFDLIPHVTVTNASFSINTFPQLGEVSVKLKNFSYAPIDRLKESSLIYGRMPAKAEEVVIDRWVLDFVLKQDGVLQNDILNPKQFLGISLDFFKKNYKGVIVGICDCGDPTLYIPWAGLISIGDMGAEIIGFSEFMKLERDQGLYDGKEPAPDECIVITNNAGISYINKIGSYFKANNTTTYKIIDALEAPTHARLVISDAAFEDFVLSMNNLTYDFYAGDKEAVKSKLIQVLERDYKGKIQYKIRDRNGESLHKYKTAASMKADARTIITVTIIALSMVMLYLLQRSYVQQRVGMLAVYRLLGLPKKKILEIFGMESFFLAMQSVLPAAVLTWTVVALLNLFTDLGFFMVLPWQAGAAIGLGILGYYLLISLVPVVRLLHLPPARLAAKYDI